VRLLKLLVLAVVAAAVLAPAALAFRFTDEARDVPVGTVGKPYAHRLTMAGGCKLVTMRVSGSFPPGLRIAGGPSTETQDSWRIEGTPTTPGSYRFWIIAGSQWPECSRDSTEEEWTIQVVGAVRPPLAVQQASLASGVVGAAYSARLTASGGGAQRWALASGALPAGVQLRADGTLVGTPGAEGTFVFTARVSDGSRSATRQLTLVVRRPLTAAVPAELRAEVGVPTRVALTADGGAAPYRWELVEGALPPGVVFDAATGAIVGTPAEAGAYPLVFQVVGSAGQTGRTPFVLRVNRRLAVVSMPLTAMTRGRPAVRRMFTSGGVGAKRWKVVRGRFPVGVRMSVVTGRLTGRPRQAGRFAFTVRVTDAHGVAALRTFVLRVRR
jgi:large repetitive protein